MAVALREISTGWGEGVTRRESGSSVSSGKTSVPCAAWMGHEGPWQQRRERQETGARVGQQDRRVTAPWGWGGASPGC